MNFSISSYNFIWERKIERARVKAKARKRQRDIQIHLLAATHTHTHTHTQTSDPSSRCYTQGFWIPAVFLVFFKSPELPWQLRGLRIRGKEETNPHHATVILAAPWINQWLVNKGGGKNGWKGWWYWTEQNSSSSLARYLWMNGPFLPNPNPS